MSPFAHLVVFRPCSANPVGTQGFNLRNSDRNVLTTHASDEVGELSVCTVDCGPVVGIREVHVPHQIA